MKKLTLLALLLSSLGSFATHLKGGYISVERLSSQNNSCRVTLIIYTDAGALVKAGGLGSLLKFGDGLSIEVPEIQSEYLGNGLGKAVYSVLHTFSVPGEFIISYTEPGRNLGMVNMSTLPSTLFYLETKINLGIPGLLSTPDPLLPPEFDEPVNSVLTLSAGARSNVDHILHYKFVTPMQGPSTYVENYQLPENIHINPFNGLITWDGKLNGQVQAGEYGISVRISSYKDVAGELQLISTMVYDFQITLSASFPSITYSSNVNVDANGRIYLPPGQSKKIKVFFEQQGASTTPEIMHATELQNRNGVYSFTSYDSSTRPNIKVGVLTLTSKSEIDRANPYLINVRGISSSTVTDAAFLLFTQDVQPPLIDRADIITSASSEDFALEAFPNPSTSLFRISLPENQLASIVVHDSAGLIVQKLSTTGSAVLDLSNINSGFYYCTVLFGSKKKVLKLIKK